MPVSTNAKVLLLLTASLCTHQQKAITFIGYLWLLKGHSQGGIPNFSETVEVVGCKMRNILSQKFFGSLDYERRKQVS